MPGVENLSITEELDFAYLLELLPVLHNVPEYSWLPELFAIVGHERLIDLCRYAGGETITIPTLDQLSSSIEALQWFYDVVIKKEKKSEDVPENLQPLFQKIIVEYNVKSNI